MSQQTQDRAVDLMLDSGAFSAWYHGDSINLKDYIAFIKDHVGLVDSYVSLDTIPGEKGRMNRSQAEIERSAAASYKNQQLMRDAGLSPIPVFHQGERFKWLERYLTDGETYIGISPYLRSNIRDIIHWMDDCFSILTDSLGRPLVQTHGFGATGHQIITRYPWRSVDSTTWARGPGYGMVKIPQRDSQGRVNVRLPSRQVFVGDDGSGKNSKFSFDNLSEPQRAWVNSFIGSLGLTITDLRNDPECRKAVNIGYLKLLERDGAIPRFNYRRGSFSARALSHSSSACCPEFTLKIIFASLINYHNQNTVMVRYGVRNRLLSYYEIRKFPDGTLEQYVSEGAVRPDVLDKRIVCGKNWGLRRYRDFRSRSLARRSEMSDGQEAAT